MNQKVALANLPHYYGFQLLDDGELQEIPLPHIDDGFQLTLNHQNWHKRHEILRRIFHTVAPNFQPFLPPFEEGIAFEIAKREYIEKLNQLFEIHGMTKIQVDIHDCVKEMYLSKIKSF